jgi:hypothetical protein
MPEYPQIGVRVDPAFLKKLDEWRRDQQDLPGRPEAIRRLVELGLSAKSPAERAKQLAEKAIDKRIPADTPAPERARRKQKLIKGKLGSG